MYIYNFKSKKYFKANFQKRRNQFHLSENHKALYFHPNESLARFCKFSTEWNGVNNVDKIKQKISRNLRRIARRFFFFDFFFFFFFFVKLSTTHRQYVNFKADKIFILFVICSFFLFLAYLAFSNFEFADWRHELSPL